MQLSFREYFRFLLVGAFIATIGVLSRELVAVALRDDSVLNYSISVLTAYVVGTSAGFFMHQRFTFSLDRMSRDWRRFALFVLVALIGMMSTWLFSLGIRYGVLRHVIAGNLAATGSFVAAALLSSLITYPLNRIFIFHRQ